MQLSLSSSLPHAIVCHILRRSGQLVVRHARGHIATRLIPPVLPPRGKIVAVQAMSLVFRSRRLRYQFLRRMRKSGIVMDATDFQISVTEKVCCITVYACGRRRCKSHFSQSHHIENF